MTKIRQFGISVEPTPAGEILPYMDDLVFYEIAMEKREDEAYLITGNIKHFPKKALLSAKDVQKFCAKEDKRMGGS